MSPKTISLVSLFFLVLSTILSVQCSCLMNYYGDTNLTCMMNQRQINDSNKQGNTDWIEASEENWRRYFVIMNDETDLVTLYQQIGSPSHTCQSSRLPVTLPVRHFDYCPMAPSLITPPIVPDLPARGAVSLGRRMKCMASLLALAFAQAPYGYSSSSKSTSEYQEILNKHQRLCYFLWK